VKIHSMLPFLDKKEINILIDEVLEKKVDLKLFDVLPYADEEKISSVIERAFNDDSIVVYVKYLLPFLNEKQMNRIYEGYQEGLISKTNVNENDMVPFLSKEKIKEMFEKKLRIMKEEIKHNIEDAIDEIKIEIK